MERVTRQGTRQRNDIESRLLGWTGRNDSKRTDNWHTRAFVRVAIVYNVSIKLVESLPPCPSLSLLHCFKGVCLCVSVELCWVSQISHTPSYVIWHRMFVAGWPGGVRIQFPRGMHFKCVISALRGTLNQYRSWAEPKLARTHEAAKQRRVAFGFVCFGQWT